MTGEGVAALALGLAMWFKMVGGLHLLAGGRRYWRPGSWRAEILAQAEARQARPVSMIEEAWRRAPVDGGEA